MAKLVILTTVLAALLGISTGARILMMVPFAAKSHAILFDRLAMELGERGHEITLITTFPQPKPLKNVREIVLPNRRDEMMKERGISLMDMRKNGMLFTSVFILPFIGSMTCDTFLGEKQIQDLLNSDEKFDLIIGETFLDESVLAGFAHKYKAPLIGLGTAAPHVWTNYMVANPSPYSYIPSIFLDYSSKMSFKERIVNTLVGLVTDLVHSFHHLRMQDNIMRKYFGNELPHVSDIIKNTSLVLSNYHFSLGFPRPYVPNMVDIGGFHFGPAKELPQDLKKYVDGSKNGVILFSLGSNLMSTMLPPEKIQMLMSAFGRLKQNVIWKFENETLPGKPDNVKISKWLPQSDLLAHPNLKLFITHGGLLSTIEAVYRGVPIVGIPMFAEQPKNMKDAENAGIGRMLLYDDMTADSLVGVVLEVLGNPRYRQEVQKKSAILRDLPKPAMETAIFWIEYILRHKGAPHLRSAAQDLAWYELYLVDVIAVLAVAGAVVLYIEFYIMRFFFRKIFKKTPSSPKKASKQKKNK